jgi:hypothetical protein
MPTKHLVIITDTSNRGVLQSNTGGKPAFKGEGEGKGEWDWLCGLCHATIGKDMGSGLPMVTEGKQPAIVTCPACQAFNEIPWPDGFKP